MTELNKKTKVLFLATWYPHRNDPMYGLFVKKHALALAPHVDLAVLNVQADVSLLSHTYEMVDDNSENISLTTVYYKPNAYASVNAMRYLISMWKGYRHLKSTWGKPTLVHQHILTRLAILALYLQKTLEIPYIITEHWSRYQVQNVKRGTYKGLLRRWLTQKAVAKAHTVTTVSEDLKIAMQQLCLSGNYKTVPNVVDVHRFTPSNVSGKSTAYFIHISCFEEISKNISGTLEAVNIAMRSGVDFKIFMVGDGPDKNGMEAYAVELGIPKDQIHFTGLKVGSELVDLLRGAVALVLFSNYENQPCAIIEAFACGVPVVATKVGGIGEIVNDSRGILVDKNDTEGMANALTSMMHQHKSFDKNELRNYAVEYFSNERVAGQFLDIYRLALADN